MRRGRPQGVEESGDPSPGATTASLLADQQAAAIASARRVIARLARTFLRSHSAAISGLVTSTSTYSQSGQRHSISADGGANVQLTG